MVIESFTMEYIVTLATQRNFIGKYSCEASPRGRPPVGTGGALLGQGGIVPPKKNTTKFLQNAVSQKRAWGCAAAKEDGDPSPHRLLGTPLKVKPHGACWEP